MRELSPYQTVVIGGAIYSVKWLPEAVDFIKKSQKVLSQIPVVDLQVFLIIANCHR